MHPACLYAHVFVRKSHMFTLQIKPVMSSWINAGFASHISAEPALTMRITQCTFKEQWSESHTYRRFYMHSLQNRAKNLESSAVLEVGWQLSSLFKMKVMLSFFYFFLVLFLFIFTFDIVQQRWGFVQKLVEDIMTLHVRGPHMSKQGRVYAFIQFVRIALQLYCILYTQKCTANT